MIKTCPICNIEFKTRKSRKVFCSAECRVKGNHLIVEKRKKSMLEKYGVENPLQNKEIKEKIKKTNLEKYGVENPAQNKEVYEKVKQTNLKKYGFTSATKNKDVRKKIEKTNLEKYGVKTNLMIDECKEQIKQTNLEKYGVEYPMQNKEILEKAYKTNLEKYGVMRPLQNKEILDKLKEDTNNNFGITNLSQQHIKHFENYNEEFIKENFIKDGYFLQNEFLKYFNVSLENISRSKKRFNISEPSKELKFKTQLKIYDFIKSFYDDDVLSNQQTIISPYELDIYIPDKKLAIEFDGLLFHSYGKSTDYIFNKTDEDKNYHLRKTELCESKGIKLFHIFENEWLDPIKREIWKSKIKLELGCIERKLNARDCVIKEVNDKDIKEFLELNHLQGYISSSIRVGLFYKDELVEVMTFGKSRFNKNFDYELLRNCTKINTIVRGGFSKLLNYFKKNYKGSIVSYGNRRWTSIINNIYKGELLNISEPNYFYFTVKDLKLMSRVQFQKHKLKDKLENFDPNLSETENMYNNGYRKIYDCGNLVYKI